jgi:hypothetical protein
MPINDPKHEGHGDGGIDGVTATLQHLQASLGGQGMS